MAHQLIVDLGTTTLAGQILGPDCSTLASAATANPQQAMGPDILTRLQRAHSGEAALLQKLLIDGIQTLLAQLSGQAGIATNAIQAAVAAGNPGISCLLRRLPVERLLYPPHKPPCRDLAKIQPAEVNLGLSVPLQLFPLVSGFVGGDLVAVLKGLGNVVPGTVVIDIGTNGELALWDGRRWWVSSAAAGPAFEGGNIQTGMSLSSGAVTNVSLDQDRFRLTVADHERPQGLCGSGLAAMIAAALQGGLIDSSGRILSPDEVYDNLANYLVEDNGKWGICFYRDAMRSLVLTQSDVRNFQLAKGAIRAGIDVLLERADTMPNRVAKVFVTGALGTALKVDVLKMVALLPEPMLDKTLFVTNGVLTGLRSYLADRDRLKSLQTLLTQVQPFPMSGTPAFEKYFLAAMNF